MKKILLASILTFIIILAIVYFMMFQPKSFNSIYKNNPSDITKILMFEGHTGENFETLDKNKINKFFNIMNQFRYTRALNQYKYKHLSGYNYYVTLFKGNQKYTITFIGKGVNFNGTVYIINNEDSIKVLNDYFELLKGSLNTPDKINIYADGKQKQISSSGDKFEQITFNRINKFDENYAIAEAIKEHPEFTGIVGSKEISLDDVGKEGNKLIGSLETKAEKTGKDEYIVTLTKKWNIKVNSTDAVSYWKYKVTPTGMVLIDSKEKADIINTIK